MCNPKQKIVSVQLLKKFERIPDERGGGIAVSVIEGSRLDTTYFKPSHLRKMAGKGMDGCCSEEELQRVLLSLNPDMGSRCEVVALLSEQLS